MKKIVILGTNNSPDYIQCYQYVVKSWNSLGWNTLTFHIDVDGQSLPAIDDNIIIKINNETEYSNVLLSQVYRLLGHRYVSADIIMTSDIDMMPLSDYWKPSINEINCYGYDLTHFKHFPICYIAANQDLWNTLIPEKTVKELLDKYPCAKSNKFDEYWYTDQHIITERIHNCSIKTNRIDRGFNRLGVAKGRIDRARLQQTLTYHEDIKIDAHLPRPFNQKFCENLYNFFHGNKNTINE